MIQSGVVLVINILKKHGFDGISALCDASGIHRTTLTKLSKENPEVFEFICFRYMNETGGVILAKPETIKKVNRVKTAKQFIDAVEVRRAKSENTRDYEFDLEREQCVKEFITETMEMIDMLREDMQK